MGYVAGQQNRTGGNNTYFGTAAGINNKTGSNNAGFGHNAGNRNIGAYNTFVGSDSDVRQAPNQPAIYYSTAIGANARVSISNALVLGDSVAGTKVGIGVTAPLFALDVKGIINLRSGGTIKFSGLTNPNLHNGSTDQFLTVNEQGLVTMAKYRLRIDKADEWADRVFAPGFSLRPLAEVDQFIQTHRHLPGIPSAEEVVANGVDSAQLTAKLLEKIEELTLYLIEVKKENQALRELVESRTSTGRK